LLIDTLGSLGALTGFADLVFVGGSLVPHGGHNPLEAAVWQFPFLLALTRLTLRPCTVT
jgi:3-deoxy-D-manno-octulosonic-acid transferase